MSVGVIRSVRHNTEYGLLRLAFAVFGRLPDGVCTVMAKGLGNAAFALLRNRREVAVDNILRSDLGCEPREAVRLARASFRHFALTALEGVRMQRLFAGDGWRTRVRFSADGLGIETLRDQPGGFLLACGHIGSWDVGAQVFSCYRPLVAIARPMDNAKAEAFLSERRFYGRVRNIPKHDAQPLRLVQLLREGAAVAIMIDQNAGRTGLPFPFLGRPASTHTGVALLPLITRAPVYFGYCLRTGLMSYEVGAAGPIACERTGNREADVRAILGALNAELEKLVRLHPEQYLWAHRRWRFR